MSIDELLSLMPGLYRAALAKTRNADDAEELVQEVCLRALQAAARGTPITSPKAYLYSILQNRHNTLLREKYKLSAVYFEELPLEPFEGQDISEIIIESEEAEAVRRELAFLSHTYREVMVRFYWQNQSVADIAKALSIPQGTVLSRLDAGRKQIRKGVENMQTYAQNSFQPETLTIAINGRSGINGEPFSLASSMLDQNILLAAYDEPVTPVQIAHTLGVPAAFVEESVNKLVSGELMKRHGTKVAADFVILTHDDRLRSVEISCAFAEKTFDEVNAILRDMVRRYDELENLSAFNATQKYLLAALCMRLGTIWRMIEAVTGKPSQDFDDYPERPNNGKWVAIGSKYPNGYVFGGESGKYSVSGRNGVHGINENISHIIEWSTALGETHRAKFKYSLPIKERALLLDAVRVGNVDPVQAELLPDMLKFGFIKEIPGGKAPAVPFITSADEKILFEIEGDAGAAWSAACLDEAAEICRREQKKPPQHISIVADSFYVEVLNGLSMYYVYEAEKRGVIEIVPGKAYPVMYLCLK
jgi:RNA polymerase sigma-70 factor (ECF subfamily)